MVQVLFCGDNSCADLATASVQNTLTSTSLEIIINLCIHRDRTHQKNPYDAEESS